MNPFKETPFSDEAYLVRIEFLKNVASNYLSRHSKNPLNSIKLNSLVSNISYFLNISWIVDSTRGWRILLFCIIWIN